MRCSPHTTHTARAGFGLVEVVIGTAIISITIVGMLAAFNLFLRASLGHTARAQASFLAEEGLEATRFIRDAGWTNVTNLATGTPYYLTMSGSAWAASVTATTSLGSFSRTVTLGDVYRRMSDHDIVDISSPDAKALDADARRVVSRVVGRGVDLSLTTYLTNVFK